jgi:3-hydroxyisobutyrate dehydrogenase
VITMASPAIRCPIASLPQCPGAVAAYGKPTYQLEALRAHLHDSATLPSIADDALATMELIDACHRAVVQRWADRLAEQQVEVEDAPVSGGVARAATGDLLVMVGGPQTAVHQVQPLLDAVARSAIAVAAEALAFAQALHLDPTATWEVLRGGAAASFMLDDRGERMVHGSDEVNSALDIFVKDMGLVLDAARDTAYPAPLASAAAQLYRAGLGRRDDSSVIEVLRGNLTASGPDRPG